MYYLSCLMWSVFDRGFRRHYLCVSSLSFVHTSKSLEELGLLLNEELVNGLAPKKFVGNFNYRIFH